MPRYPDIETDRLILRRLIGSDLDFIFRHFSDPEVSRYLVDAEKPSTIDEAAEILRWCMPPDPEAACHNRWGIVLKRDHVLMGTCGFHNWDEQNRIAEIGYDLSPAFRGSGYMTEAVRAALKSGFENMNLNRIQAFVHLENERSTVLLRRLGFMLEGVIRAKHYFRGQYYDHYCYSLLRHEWTE